MRPDESSTVQEILSYKPSGWSGSLFWFYEKERLLKLKEMNASWTEWTR